MTIDQAVKMIATLSEQCERGEMPRWAFEAEVRAILALLVMGAARGVNS